MRLQYMRYKNLLAALAASALLITGCSPNNEDAAPAPASSENHDAHEHAHAEGHDHDVAHDEGLSEVSRISPRAIIATEKGITTIDTVSGDVLDATERPGFLRLNHAGDGRHILVTDGNKVLSYDAAVETVPHGDHNHYYAGDPSLTDQSFEAPKAGHVVVNADRTAIFSDGTGIATLLDEDLKEIGTIETGAPHHGVAVPLADGTTLATRGTEEHRDTIALYDADGTKVLAETHECPGVHGEAVASGERVVFGCEDGPIIFDGGTFHKVKADGYQRNGNLAGDVHSPVVLADHKTEKDAELERPEKIALIDVDSREVKTVDLGSPYWFRSLARAEDGFGVVLTYDGHLKLIDTEKGEVTADIPAIGEWKEKEEWQEPGPILQVVGNTAFVTDAEKKELVLIDLDAGEEIARHSLDAAPVEMIVADGR